MDLPARHSAAVDYGTRLSTIYQRIAQFTVRETKTPRASTCPRKPSLPTMWTCPLGRWRNTPPTATNSAYEYDTDGVVEIDNVDSILKRLLRLVQCASNPALIDGRYEHDPAKFPLLLDMCREFTAGSKLIIWTGFIDNVNWLAAKLVEFDPVCIHGSLPMHQRNQAVQSFTNSSNLVPHRDTRRRQGRPYADRREPRHLFRSRFQPR